MTNLPSSNWKVHECKCVAQIFRTSIQKKTRISKKMDVMVTGFFQTCKVSTLGKAQKTNVSKTVNKCWSYGAVEWLFIDISSPTATSLGGKKYWLLMVNDHTDYMEFFFKKKVSCLTKSTNQWNCWRQNITFKFKRFNVRVQMKIVHWRDCVKKKEMVLLLNIKCLAHLSKMVMLSKNYQHCLAQWVQCWMEVILLTLKKDSCGFRL